MRVMENGGPNVRIIFLIVLITIEWTKRIKEPTITQRQPLWIVYRELRRENDHFSQPGNCCKIMTPEEQAILFTI